ncbi:hypothetical protein Q1695_008989 [Nippostrongylus brasiliensis]|nr:hypothetical protein Q1695_008989 [Nippostrongylus brasiliensis]
MNTTASGGQALETTSVKLEATPSWLCVRRRTDGPPTRSGLISSRVAKDDASQRFDFLISQPYQQEPVLDRRQPSNVRKGAPFGCVDPANKCNGG